jgi:hypothetical protein
VGGGVWKGLRSACGLGIFLVGGFGSGEGGVRGTGVGVPAFLSWITFGGLLVGFGCLGFEVWGCAVMGVCGLFTCFFFWVVCGLPKEKG